jgi:hypothetical protein
MKRLLRWITKFHSRHCQHPRMLADVCEGDALPTQVRWCPDCGAVQVDESHIRLPGEPP